MMMRSLLAITGLIVVLSEGEAGAQQKDVRSLEPPPIAKSNPKSVEVLRVWAAPGGPQQLTLHPTWPDPAVWGLMLADIARHAARAYGEQGQDPETSFNRIISALHAELKNPTDKPKRTMP